jgi:DNA-binding NarL/FixJ family response regulator
MQEITALLMTEFDVVATAADGQSALELIRLHRPDVAVLDLEMPLLSGIAVTKELATCPNRTAVVICSVSTDRKIVEAARDAGALGYVFKTRVHKDLIAAVHAVACGRAFVSTAE